MLLSLLEKASLSQNSFIQIVIFLYHTRQNKRNQLHYKGYPKSLCLEAATKNPQETFSMRKTAQLLFAIHLNRSSVLITYQHQSRKIFVSQEANS